MGWHVLCSLVGWPFPREKSLGKSQPAALGSGQSGSAGVWVKYIAILLRLYESRGCTEDPQPCTLALGQAPTVQLGSSSPGNQKYLCRVQEETRGAAFTGCSAVG